MRDAFNTAVKQKRPVKHRSPVTIRLTQEERTQLELDAAGRTLSSYIRWKLFEGRIKSKALDKRPKRKLNQPSYDHILLAQLLGMLGQAGLSQNLSQIAKAAIIGALPVTEELSDELHAACGDIREMRDTLMKALGHVKV